MNPAPGTDWPDLHYADTEQVELDLAAIIARGARLRRQRLIRKAAAVALVIGVAPAVVIADMTGPAVVQGFAGAPVPPDAKQADAGTFPGPANAGLAGPDVGFGTAGHVAAPGSVSKSASKPTSRPVIGGLADNSTKSDELMLSLAPATVRPAVTLARGYGRLLAVAGARGSSGLWFAATAAQLTLFHLSLAGALRSWSLPASANGVRASGGVGLAVTSAGVAWIGVGATLLSLDTRSTRLRTWQLPAHDSLPDRSLADSVAVSPGGQVAVATSDSSSVQVLDPLMGTFRQIKLPDVADQPLALGYARNGVLGIGYRRLGRLRSGAVLLVEPTGGERSTAVPQPTAIAPFGASGLLVGVTRLDVVSPRRPPRPLAVPGGPPDYASVMTPPIPLPGGRLGIATDAAILTFPATTSYAVATTQSQFWVIPSRRCQPHQACPSGYRLLASDVDGDVWAVPKARPRTVELVSLR